MCFAPERGRRRVQRQSVRLISGLRQGTAVRCACFHCDTPQTERKLGGRNGEWKSMSLRIITADMPIAAALEGAPFS